MNRKRRRIVAASGVVCVFVIWCVFFSSWPDPGQAVIPWKPDAILIVGGGDAARVRQGMLLAARYPNASVIVTGDGQSIVRGLLEAGLSESRMIHEQDAESTKENATLTKPILDRLGAEHVVLVSNWFHVPRVLAVFRKFQPAREFAASFEQKPVPLTSWDRGSQRRERFAAVLYLLRYGVWSW